MGFEGVRCGPVVGAGLLRAGSRVVDARVGLQSSWARRGVRKRAARPSGSVLSGGGACCELLRWQGACAPAHSFTGKCSAGPLLLECLAFGTSVFLLRGVCQVNEKSFFVIVFYSLSCLLPWLIRAGVSLACVFEVCDGVRTAPATKATNLAATDYSR